MLLQVFAVLLPLLLLLLLLLGQYYRSSSRGRHHRSGAPREPPSPFRLPVIGNLHQLGPLAHRSLRDMSRVHGPLMLLRFGSRPVLVVSSADTAQEVTKANDLAFASRPSIAAAKELFYNCTDVSFAPYGAHWRQAKKLCTLHLLSAKRVQSYAAVRSEEVTAMVGKIAKWSASAAGPVNLSRILNSFANEVITRVALGRKYHTLERECESNSFCEMVEEMFVLFSVFDIEDYFPWLRWLAAATAVRARMRRCFRRVDSFLEQVLEDHLGGAAKDGGGSDLVDVLLSLQGYLGTSRSLSRDAMKAIILDMFSAGTDTSYVTMEWAMTELARNPEEMEKVQREIRGVAEGEKKSMVTEDEVSQMPYLEAVIKEVLRLHPPGPLLLPRESTRDACIGGYEIPAKTKVLINAWAIGRDLACWEEPEEFRPERFVGSPVDFKGQDFQYIPFGAGRRICPGTAFAISTVKLALANLLHRFDWKLPGRMRAEDLDVAEAAGLTTRKKSNLLLVAMPPSL